MCWRDTSSLEQFGDPADIDQTEPVRCPSEHIEVHQRSIFTHHPAGLLGIPGETQEDAHENWPTVDRAAASRIVDRSFVSPARHQYGGA